MISSTIQPWFRCIGFNLFVFRGTNSCNVIFHCRETYKVSGPHELKQRERGTRVSRVLEVELNNPEKDD
jgi:hypothetical protein